MPISVNYTGGNGVAGLCTIRPTPLVNISTTILKNGAGDAYGMTYTITLTGTLLPSEGTPYAVDTKGIATVGGGADFGRFPFFTEEYQNGTEPNVIGPYGAFDNNYSHTQSKHPPRQKVPGADAATALFAKQRALRSLFSKDGQQITLTDIDYNTEAVICYPRVVSMDFPEGPFVNKAEYTIVLEADVLIHRESSGFIVDEDGTTVPRMSGGVMQAGVLPSGGLSNHKLVEELGAAFVSDYNEDWSIEVDDALSENADIPRSYRISHNLSATGKTHYMMPNTTDTSEVDAARSTKIPAWESARKFVTNKINDDGAKGYPNVLGQIGSGTLNLISQYGGFNCVRTENVNEYAGTFGISETWVISSGTALENFTVDISTSTGEPFVNVGINGTITGLSKLAPSAVLYGGVGASGALNKYDNAINKYNQITNSGNFGLTSDIFKRVDNQVAVQLNSQPISTSLGVNESVGEITYSLQFNNRPTNIISGVLSENISVNDTYPGDIYAVVPVIGRTTGPVLQYIGGRTEYRRDIAIDLLMDYTDIPYGTGRNPLLLKKPSIVEPTASQLAALLKELSPQSEPGVRKCFIDPPTESWSPKEGAYNFSISFTYELDK